ncbi:MAG: hypothetical protein AAF616_15985, partial [Bacteroidota bacterium]
RTSVDRLVQSPLSTFIPKLTKSWSSEGRNFYKYSLPNSAPFEWYFGSADYKVHSFEVGTVACQVFHQPSHTYNLPFFKKSLENAINFVQSSLGQYPYDELKLVEIPFYQEPLYSYPNTIAISELEGWFADTTSLENQVYLSFSIASGVISHWALQNLPIANVQGADMLRYALPEALAMQVVEAEYGTSGLQGLITKKQGLYARERGTEPNVEPTLIAADGAEYLERNKGTLALYELSQKMGDERFNEHIENWAKGMKGKGVFRDLYQSIMANEQIIKLSEEDQVSIKNTFEKVLP